MTFLQGVRPVDEFQARYSSETFKSQISKITKLTNKSTLDPVGLTKLASNQKRAQLPEPKTQSFSPDSDSYRGSYFQ